MVAQNPVTVAAPVPPPPTAAPVENTAGAAGHWYVRFVATAKNAEFDDAIPTVV
jgi:hypothetical protein